MSDCRCFLSLEQGTTLEQYGVSYSCMCLYFLNAPSNHVPPGATQPAKLVTPFIPLVILPVGHAVHLVAFIVL